MLQLYKNIKQKRLELGMTQTELALKMGYAGKSMIAKIEKGLVDLPQSKILAFAEALNTSASELMGWTDEDIINVTNIYPIEKRSFPVLGKIACGVPTYANEERECYIMAGADIDADFCLIAKGDSMINARINNGDIVFIRKQDAVDNGDIAAVIVNDNDEATLKRVFYYRDKALLVLRAENPAYEDMIFQNEELNNIHILGKAVAFQSDVT